MFQHLDLSEQEKLRYFLQGLHRETRREILIKQPKTYREAEDAARLLQMVDYTIGTENSAPNQLNDKIIDAVVKATMAAQGSMRSTPERYSYKVRSRRKRLPILAPGPQRPL